MYVDVLQRDVQDRFDNCRIKNFSYDKNDASYIERGWFKAVRKMFEEEKGYVLEQVRRITGNQLIDYKPVGTSSCLAGK